MKIQIKHKTTRKVIKEVETNLRRADLRGADLRGADLWRADLREAKIKMTLKEQILQAIGIQIEDDI